MANRGYADYIKRKQQAGTFVNPIPSMQSVFRGAQPTPATAPTSSPSTQNTQNSQTKAPTPYESYLQDLYGQQSQATTQRNENMDRERQRYLADLDNYNKQYENYAKSLQGNVGVIDKRISGVDKQLKDTLGLQEQQAQLERENTQRTADQNTRDLATAKQTLDNQLRNKFAGLGTVDSGGYQGYTGQQTSLNRDYLRQRANAQESTASNLQGVDLALRKAQLEAQSKASDVIFQYENLVKDIQKQLAGLPDQQKQAQLQAYRSLEDALSGINNDYQSTDSEIRKGIFDVSLQGAKAARSSGGAKQLKSDALGTVNKLLGSNLAAVSGTFRYGNTPLLNQLGGSGDTQTLIDQLKSQLQLDNIKYLKGSGQISDAEQRIVAAVNGLDQGKMSETAFFQRLGDIQVGLAQDLLREETGVDFSADEVVTYLTEKGLR